MHKTLLLMLAVASAIVFTGCASVSVTTPDKLNGEPLSYRGDTVAHLHAENWGIYLFMIPLLTGSTENPGEIAVLKDTVNVDCMMNVITAKAKAIGAKKTLNLVSQTTTIPFFFGMKSVQISANAIK